MLDIGKTVRVLPIHVINPRADKQTALSIGEELESLIATFGGIIVDRVIQKLSRPDNATYIGSGKIAEVAEQIKEFQVDLVILSSMAKSRQIYELKKQFQEVNPNIDVWDRVDLILNIFEKHATTKEAKLQIELARMGYMGPRIYGMGFIMSRQGGGIGSSGIGETNTELMKRHWRKEMKRVSDEIDALTKTREQQLERRKKTGYKTVSIVGYTNAGKSSLFNLLTGKKTLVENVLFATLDSSVGAIYIPEMKQEILLTDTIGFIRDLPPRLIKAFTSTLMESIHADVLLHVIDASDPEIDAKITAVNEILQEMKIDPYRVVFIFNKCDLISAEQMKNLMSFYANYAPICISTKNTAGIQAIHSIITQYLTV